jgi:hypothetical protein
LTPECIKFFIGLFKVEVILKLEGVLGLATSLLLSRARWPVETTARGSASTSATSYATTVNPTTTPWCLRLLLLLL